MRTIRPTTRFKKDYKREKAGRHAKTLDAALTAAVDMLACDTSLPRRNFDHPLAGKWKDCRDCHIKPDLILIYRKPDAHTLELVRLGSHGELGF
jgi:mRNA interferase YafQ